MKKYMSSIYDLFIHETTTISSKTPEIINTLFYQDVNNSFKLPLEFVPETKEVNIILLLRQHVTINMGIFRLKFH